ncbi:MAG: DUF368 domain-containing protein [Cellvibrionaceae bacterium]|nr:DUF368 domain-containing protein [Cellvibrionaceae bacterium]
MGAADVVPGVSGGTVAFITGIYQRLLNALKSLSPAMLRIGLREGFGAFWQAIDGWFLLVLFAGILTSVVSLANIISYSLENHPILVWSFFFGLVLASVVYLCRQIPRWQLQQFVAVLLGAVIALVITYMRPAQLPAQWWMMFLAGAIAICAMILPGISGSFILLLMGMYAVVINALKTWDILLLSSFAGGCIVGLLGFSHLLSWLLARYHCTTLALLTGFLVGSLNLLWPWKQVVASIEDRHGELVPLVQKNISPGQFADITQQPSLIGTAALCAIVGFLLVLLLERIGNSNQTL